MLGPLAELAPQLPHPTAGATIGELWQKFDQRAHALIAEPIDLNALK
jgi:7,8-dihydro-6-hydroxymethylpterin-pyrophosphokinase